MALAAFAQYEHAYEECPTFIHGVPYARYVLPAAGVPAALDKLAGEPSKIPGQALLTAP
ncbi:hypothetical protein [Massilia sp. BSC265]|uniref:hypothetical protein n=1 Tax=Massilia sp. BSC265 TaxID=1549812 RepID=UPI0013766062|nr:hypothetical protein [Massilia sp. BSC265]